MQNKEKGQDGRLHGRFSRNSGLEKGSILQRLQDTKDPGEEQKFTLSPEYKENHIWVNKENQSFSLSIYPLR